MPVSKLQVAHGNTRSEFGLNRQVYISYKPHSVQRQQRKIKTHISGNTTTADKWAHSLAGNDPDRVKE